MIEVRGLAKRYGPAVAAGRLSFTVRPGTVTGFLGPNGSGKPTTLRMIMGLDFPDSGQARIGGRASCPEKDFRPWPARAPARIVNWCPEMGVRSGSDRQNALFARC
ncbi:MAG: transporter, ATP-binding protein, partial [Actinomycetia bacterium]|nr:transporter, ATP-binding protein [Actinomycetes bacterium]